MKVLSLVSVIYLAIALLLKPVQAAESEEPLILVSHCMKSLTSDYPTVEKELWQPLHQQMVDQGQKNGWSVYWVKYGNRYRCDYYVVETYLGMAQYNSADESLAKAYAQAHDDKGFKEFIARTEASRTMVESSLWILREGIEIKPHKQINVNWMKADDPAKYLALERELWKPIYQYSAQDGLSNGWAVYELLLPTGANLEYNFVTVDFLTDVKYLPLESIVKKVHPGLPLQSLFKKTEVSRSNVLTQTWSKVTGTTPKKK